MGTSIRYSSAADAIHQHQPPQDIYLTPGVRPAPSSANHSDDILLALTRVDQSLRVVLAAIHEIQREMGINTSSQTIAGSVHRD